MYKYSVTNFERKLSFTELIAQIWQFLSKLMSYVLALCIGNADQKFQKHYKICLIQFVSSFKQV